MFGSKKQIQAEHGKKELNDMIENLEKQKKSLIDRKIELENKKKTIDSWIKEKQAHDIRRRTEEGEY